jgi:hypothetical protein
VLVGAEVHALLLLHVDPEHGGAELDEVRVQLGREARRRIRYDAQRGERNPPPAQRLDAAHDPVVRRLAAPEPAPRGQGRRPVNAQSNVDIVVDEVVAPRVVDEGGVGLDMVLHAAKRRHELTEVVASGR